MAVFARDMESSQAVWSSQNGYPGDSNYREYYRDIGHDLDYDYLSSFLEPVGYRRNTGIKYHRVSGEKELRLKLPYHRPRALKQAALHAGNFMFTREKHGVYLYLMMSV